MERKLVFPIDSEMADSLQVRDQILIYGRIYCGRDAVLPNTRSSV